MNKSIQTAYIDLLTALFAIFLALYAVKSQAEASRGNMSAKAEFIVTLDWRDASLNDIDLWVKGPEGLIFFKQKNAGSMTLDRDDRGFGAANDPMRREIATIRSIVPGRYVVNAMMWSNKGGPEPVKVSVLKLNPYRPIAEKSATLENEGQELTVASFDVDERGNVTFVDTETAVSLGKR